MDYYSSCKAIALPGLIYCLSIAGNASASHISLKKAMAGKLITVSAISTGGYCGKSLKLALKNNSVSALEVDVDPGLIFRPEDTSMQDLVVLGNETIVLAPAQEKAISLQTFCGKSYASGPSANRRYNYWKQGDSSLIRALCYVKENNINIHLAQKAVWSFTNNHCLNTVYSGEQPGVSERFVRYLAALKHSRVPEYFVDYKLDTCAGRRVIVADQSTVFANMHWADDAGYRNMHLVIYKSNGDVYKTIGADRVIDKYGYTVKVQFDPKRDPKGLYYVKLYDDANKVWDQKKVIVGARECDLFF